MIIGSLIILALYGLLLIWVRLGITKLSKPNSPKDAGLKQFSIIVVFRNEVKNLPELLASLLNLNYPSANFELLFIDDQSTDGGAELIESTLKKSTINYSLHANKRFSNAPKKDGITLGVELAKYNWIVTLDADCICPKDWLLLITNQVTNLQPDLLIGPVKLSASNLNLLSTWQVIEHMGLQQFARGSSGHNRPILANGANLIYSKALFESLDGFSGNNQIASGDDQFLLEKASKANKKVAFLNNYLAAVTTQAAPNWKAAINQRIRWAAKSNASTSWLLKSCGLVIAIANLWLIALGFWALLAGPLWYFAFVYFCVKIVLDFWFLPKNRALKPSKLGLNIVLSNMVYPIVLLRITLQGFMGGYHWKQRHFKK